MTEPRTDRHRHPPMGIRPDRELQDGAKTTLEQHGWNLTEYISACLASVIHRPAATLEQLAEFRPSTPRGRPRKAQQP